MKIIIALLALFSTAAQAATIDNLTIEHILSLPSLTVSRACVLDSSGHLASSPTTAAQLAALATPGNLTSSTSGVTITGGSGSVLGSGTALNIQTASGSQNGLLSSTDWTRFDNNTSSYTFTAPLINTTGTITCRSATGSVSGCLTSTDWSTFNSKQAALSFGNFTSPTTGVSVTGGTGAVIGSGVALSIQNATTGQPGLLTAADWNTFNSKQSALTLGNLTSSTTGLSVSGGTGAVIGSGAALSIQNATTAQPGLLTAGDWNTFNGKQAAGNYMTALTQDVTAAGPGSSAATVNSVGGSSAANIHTSELATAAATSANTASTIVKRDGSGNFAGGTITSTQSSPGNLRLSGNTVATSSGNIAANPTGAAWGSAVTAEWTVLQQSLAGTSGAIHAQNLSGWEGYAVAPQMSSSGDWAINFKVDSTGSIGLVVGMTTAYNLGSDSYTQVNFGLVVGDGGSYFVDENGSFGGSLGSVSTSDVLTVRNVGGTVTYLLNGSVVATSGTGASGTYFPIVALNSSTGSSGVSLATVTLGSTVQKALTTASGVRMGVGTSTPAAALDVQGEAFVLGNVASVGGFYGPLFGNLVGNVVGNLTGIASTASALTGTPSQCSGGQFSLGINSNGDANCGTPSVTTFYQTVQSSGVDQTQRNALNFGSAFSLSDSSSPSRTTVNLAGTITATLIGNSSTATAPASGSAHGAVTLGSGGAFQTVAPSTSGGYLRSNGTDFVRSTIQAGDVPTLNQNTTGTAALATAPGTGSAHGAVTLDVSGNFQSVAPSTAGGYLRSNGTDFVRSTIQVADVPTLNQNTTGSAGTATTATSPVTGTSHGAVTLDSSGAFQSVAPGTAGNYLRSNGTDYVQSTIQAADVPTLNQSTTGNAATATKPASGTSHGAVVLDSSGNFSTVAPSTAGKVLRSNGTDFASSVLDFSDLSGTASLTSQVTGVLPRANGGTNSSTALNNNRFMVSSGGKIDEAAAVAANVIVTTDANGLPTSSGVTDTLAKCLDPSLAMCGREEFTAPTAALTPGWQENKTGTGAGWAVQTGSSNHPGVIGLNAGTTSTGVDPIRLYTSLFNLGGGTFHFKSSAQTSILATAATIDYVWRHGLQTNFSVQAGANTDGYWWEYNRAYTFTCTGTTVSGNATISNLTGCSGVIDPSSIQVGQTITGTGVQAASTIFTAPGAGTSLIMNQTANASGTVTLTFSNITTFIAAVASSSTQYRQVTSQTVSAATYYNLEFTVNAAATSVTFSINSSLLATIAQGTTNAIGPVIMMYNTAYTSGAPIVKTDYMAWEYYFTTPR